MFVKLSTDGQYINLNHITAVEIWSLACDKFYVGLWKPEEARNTHPEYNSGPFKTREAAIIEIERILTGQLTDITTVVQFRHDLADGLDGVEIPSDKDFSVFANALEKELNK